MTRLRYNGLSARLGAPLTNVATAITFDGPLTHSGGIAVPTIISGDFIRLAILDAPGRLAEIVNLTAYTAGATTGTIVRAQEDTTGKAHGTGVKVANTVTTSEVANLPELARNLFRWPSPHKALAKWASQWGTPTVLADGLRYTAPSSPGGYASYPVPTGAMATLPAGTVGTLRQSFRVPAGRVGTLRLYSQAGGVDNGVDQVAFTGTGQRQTLEVKRTLPADGIFYPTLFLDAPQAGDVVDVYGPLTISLGGVLGAFDGDTAGSRWEGVPHASESVKVVYGPEVRDHLVWLDAGRAQGVGSPEGKIVAPVGTRYIDTARTIGALEWMKDSGVGATGWRCTVGDTGWRDLPLAVGTGTFRARRCGDVVEFRLANYVPGTTGNFTFATVVGWGPAVAVEKTVLNPNTSALVRVNIGSDDTHYLYGVPSGAVLLGSYTYLSDDPWPTTLPGTPT